MSEESEGLTKAKLDRLYKRLTEDEGVVDLGSSGPPPFIFSDEDENGHSPTRERLLGETGVGERSDPGQQVRFKEVPRTFTREEVVSLRLRDLEFAREVLRNAREDYQEAKRNLKAAKKGPITETVTSYVPVRPGEDGYEDLPDRFDPDKYQGEFGWGVVLSEKS